MTDYVLTGLVKRRAELAGLIEKTSNDLQKMITDLDVIDKAILQFDPDYVVKAIKSKSFRPPKDWSNRGEMTKMVLSILRMAAEPLTSRDIAIQMITERSLEPTERLTRLMVKRVGVCLRDKRDQGVVRSEQGPGMYQTWEITK